MKIQKFLVGLLLIPGTIHAANISFEINKLFEDIFSGKKEQAVIQEPKKIPEISLPDNFAKENPEKLQEAINIQTIELKNFETKILDLEAEIYELEEQDFSLSEELQSVDEELSALTKNVLTISEQEAQWHKKLTENTKKIAELRTKIRIEKQALNRDMNKNFIQSKILKGNEDVSLIQWLFSDKTVSQILAERKTKAQKQRQQYIRIKNLESLEAQLALREKTAVEFYHTFSNLKASLETQRKALIDISQSKASKLKNITTKKLVRERALDTYKEKEEEAYLFLVGLQKSQEFSPEAEKIPGKNTKREDFSDEDASSFSLKNLFSKSQEKTWISPLKKPLSITAEFLDPEYEKAFGKPHFGTDFESPQGSDLFAPQDGTIIRAEDNGFDYSYLVLDHGNELYSLYGHLSEILVREGDIISQGDLLAKTGGTPGTHGAGYFTTGPHLHVEIFADGQHQNPLNYLGALVE